MIIDILRGSKNEKIRRFELEDLSTWGIMSDTSTHRIRAILDLLIKEKILLLEEGEYPVVTLGNAGALLRDERMLTMKLPTEQKKSEQKNTGQKKSGRNTIQYANIDQVLFEKLKKLRKELAQKDTMPAYIIFSDASLRDMCIKKPVSLVQFSTVNGVGGVKLEKYGEIFTELIRDHVS
jgi:ATP-dependent DNA helicase RecQ